MRASILRWLLCLGVMAVALYGIARLQSTHTEVPCPPDACFRKSGERIRDCLDICYHDFKGSRHHFTCRVEDSFSDQEARSFGYPLDQESNLRELDARLARAIREGAGPKARYLRARVSPENFQVSHLHARQGVPGGIQWESTIPGLPEGDKEIRKAQRELAVRIFGDYMREKGFTLSGSTSNGHGLTFEIDYRRLADRAKPKLGECFDRFIREAAPADDDEVVSLLLAAFQEASVKPLPPAEGQRYVAGFRVPTGVLRLRQGDCDSNAAAFCALWQDPRPQILLYVVENTGTKELPRELREHVLLGIRGYPGINQAFVQEESGTFVLCEVWRPAGHDGVGIGSTLSDEPRPGSGICMTDHCLGGP